MRQNNWLFKIHPLFEGRSASSIRCMISAFHKVHWQYFSGEVDMFKNTDVEFLQESGCQKLFKSVYFWWNYFKNKNVATFLGTHCSMYMQGCQILLSSSGTINSGLIVCHEIIFNFHITAEVIPGSQLLGSINGLSMVLTMDISIARLL